MLVTLHTVPSSNTAETLVNVFIDEGKLLP